MNSRLTEGILANLGRKLAQWAGGKMVDSAGSVEPSSKMGRIVDWERGRGCKPLVDAGRHGCGVGRWGWVGNEPISRQDRQTLVHHALARAHSRSRLLCTLNSMASATVWDPDDTPNSSPHYPRENPCFGYDPITTAQPHASSVNPTAPIDLTI